MTVSMPQATAGNGHGAVLCQSVYQLCFMNAICEGRTVLFTLFTQNGVSGLPYCPTACVTPSCYSDVSSQSKNSLIAVWQCPEAVNHSGA